MAVLFHLGFLLVCSLVGSIDGGVGTSGEIAIGKQLEYRQFFRGCVKQPSVCFSLRSSDVLSATSLL